MKHTPIEIPYQVKHVFGLAFLLAMGLIFIAIINYQNAKDLMYENMANHAVNVAMSLEGIASNQDLADNYQITDLLANFPLPDDIGYLSIINEQGQILAQQARTNLKVLRPGKAEINIFENRTVKVIENTLNADPIYEVVVPLHVGRLEGNPHEADDGHPKMVALRVGIYRAAATQVLRPAIIQSFLVVVFLITVVLLGFSQYKTLKEYFILQGQIKHQEKLAAIGLLAAGVAHEIRNPLGSIKGFTQLLQEDDNPEDEKRKYLTAMLKETNRLERFLELLLNYTRKRELNKNYWLMKEMFDEVFFMLRDQTENSQVSLEQEILPHDLQVLADAEGIRQVLVNGILNSIQAMPEGGQVLVKAYFAKGNVIIDILDTGIGLKQDLHEKVMQPFFTTKAKGIGLGLALSQQIIEQHNGRISLSNREAGGAQLHIIIPQEGE